MRLGYIGLGKMGESMASRLLEINYEIVVYDKNTEAINNLEKKGAKGSRSLEDMIEKLDAPRLVWLMVPHQVTSSVIKELALLLQKGDIVIDGGNTQFTDTLRHSKILEDNGVYLLDAGISGGPYGAKNGSCVMIGGDKDIYDKYENLFKDLSISEGYAYVGKTGAGHFVKMIHNGIEYGIMQSIAEGFNLLHKSDYNLDVEKIATLYNHGSVIESHLVKWLEEGYKKYGNDLKDISGSVDQNGEGGWTSEYAQKIAEKTPSIDLAVQFRKDSQNNPSYTGQVVSTLRHEFGGHTVSNKEEKK